MSARRVPQVDDQMRLTMGQAALAKATTYSNRAVQQRMIDNYHAAYATQVSRGGRCWSVAVGACGSRGGGGGRRRQKQ